MENVVIEIANVEQLDRLRRCMLLGFLDGYLAWQLPQVVNAVWGDVLPGHIHTLLNLTMLLGVVSFVFYGWRIIRIHQRAQDDPAVGAALNDERVCLLRHRALATGFWTVILYLGGICLTDLVHPLGHTGAWAQLGLLIAATSAIVSFLWYDRETD